MNTQASTDFDRIQNAIGYIHAHFREQPQLEEIAASIHLSPFHFQKLFTEWAGVSPKKFLQYITIEHAKKILKENDATLFDTAIETGLSGTGRLHDLFINIEGMTPGEYKNGGESLSINYSFAESPFGNILVASTPRGICYMAFADNRDKEFDGLKKLFPKASFRQMTDRIQQNVLHIFTDKWEKPEQVKLHLKGTEFQIKVWETLLRIPLGQMTTYGSIAKTLNNPNASRAVGSAVGDNPVAFLIPCHRVIQSTGVLGNYHWGSNRKAAMIGWEASRATN
ncbi:methylated-DNA--[protein]-cysteine S-methyltransferase [Ferruginibacter sp. HRS2-29]|uniref:bifunctional helix-turn-helix domain-containing protein/methylated-DNA--[protein]-cysteine S-methyltransferase n=1 Tax=Ferruginibacter sp. HRS2-29 TaxID=2487334 RepID=UPI0020CE5F1C|nr:methylated-DNA--[protein]-cysteine S-methyltransferase [Ferruginibacter sp. HRS2-29]MCP9749418.1 methylated-DNA--[protein]-cysteine S-methyltransferase [Ferruginibacter sp. HRS2-29]